MLENPYYNLSGDIGFDYHAAREAIRADMATRPGKHHYTNAEAIQVLITAGVISDASAVSGLGWLLPDIEQWLEQFKQ